MISVIKLIEMISGFLLLQENVERKMLLVMNNCHLESPAHDGLPAWIMIRYLQRGF